MYNTWAMPQRVWLARRLSSACSMLRADSCRQDICNSTVSRQVAGRTEETLAPGVEGKAFRYIPATLITQVLGGKVGCNIPPHALYEVIQPVGRILPHSSFAELLHIKSPFCIFDERRAAGCRSDACIATLTDGTPISMQILLLTGDMGRLNPDD